MTVPDLRPYYSEMILVLFAIVLPLVDAFSKKKRREVLGILSLIGIALAFWVVYRQWTDDPMASGIDGFGVYFKMLFLIVSALTVLMSLNFLRMHDLFSGEYFAFLLLATAGMNLVANAQDFVELFISLELISLSTYLLISVYNRQVLASEAALKYFLLSVFASALFLFGVAWAYGATGETGFAQVAQALAGSQNPKSYALVITIMITSGLALKMAAAPFHMYAPDVYQGAPTMVSAFLSVGPKAAAFAAMIKVSLVALPVFREEWRAIVIVLAVISMLWGNIAALTQRNVKRMLAYSSVAHAGYLLVGVAAALSFTGETPARDAAASVVFYLIAYSLMNLGAFGMLLAAEKRGEFIEELDDLAGLSKKMPGVSLMMLIFILSLAGIPPTMGFFGKFYVFADAIRAEMYLLALFAVLNTAVAVYYYLRVLVYIYIREEETEVWPTYAGALTLALFIACAAIIFFGCFPDPILEGARYSVETLSSGIK